MNTSNKTLLQILTEELPKRGGWPNNATHCVCMADEHVGVVSFTKDGAPVFNNESNEWTILTDNDSSWHYFDFESEQPIDRETSIITRDQYEAALEEKEHPLPWDEKSKPCPTLGAECRGCPDCGRRVSCTSDDITDDAVRAEMGMNSRALDAALAKQVEQMQIKGNLTESDFADLNDCIGQAPAPVWNGEGLPPVGAEFNYGSHRSRAKCLAVGLHYVFASKGNPDDEEGDYEEFLIDAKTDYYPVDDVRDSLMRDIMKAAGIMAGTAETIANQLIDAGYRKQ